MLDFGAVNWVAVVVAGIVSFALGGVWYTAFSKPWMAFTGITRETANSGGKGQMAFSYGVAFVTYLVAAAVLALLLDGLGATDAASGLLIGFLVGIGFVATTSYNNYMFAGRPMGLYLIDQGYPVVALAIAGVILALWQ